MEYELSDWLCFSYNKRRNRRFETGRPMRQLWQPSAVGPSERDCLQLGSQREELGLVLHCSEVVVYIAHSGISVGPLYHC